MGAGGEITGAAPRTAAPEPTSLEIGKGRDKNQVRECAPRERATSTRRKPLFSNSLLRPAGTFPLQPGSGPGRSTELSGCALRDEPFALHTRSPHGDACTRLVRPRGCGGVRGRLGKQLGLRGPEPGAQAVCSLEARARLQGPLRRLQPLIRPPLAPKTNILVCLLGALRDRDRLFIPAISAAALLRPPGPGPRQASCAVAPRPL